MSERSVYVEESGSTIYLPREHYTLNAARHEAASHAQMEDPGFGRSRYLGRQAVPLHDHEDWEECNECPEVAVWVFETYEGTYRD